MMCATLSGRMTQAIPLLSYEVIPNLPLQCREAVQHYMFNLLTTPLPTKR